MESRGVRTSHLVLQTYSTPDAVQHSKCPNRRVIRTEAVGLTALSTNIALLTEGLKSNIDLFDRSLKTNGTNILVQQIKENSRSS